MMVGDTRAHAHTLFPKAHQEPQVSSQDAALGQEPEKAQRSEAEDKLFPRTFIRAWAQREYDQKPSFTAWQPDRPGHSKSISFYPIIDNVIKKINFTIIHFAHLWGYYFDSFVS